MKLIHIITPKWRQPEDLHPTPFDAYRFRGGAGALVRFSYQMERPVGVEPTNAAFAVPYPADECWTHKTACNIFKVAMKPKKLRLFTIYNAVNQGVGGSEGLRSLYLLLARQALYQLSYTPIKCGWIANPSYLPTSARRTHLQIIVILCEDEDRKTLTSVQTQCPKWESNPQNSGSKPDTYSIRLPGQSRPTRTRTQINGFGDRYATITPSTFTKFRCYLAQRRSFLYRTNYIISYSNSDVYGIYVHHKMPEVATSVYINSHSSLE